MRFAITNLLRQKKISALFGITLILMTIICYMFLALLYDPYFSLDTSRYDKMIMGSATTLFIVIFTACLIIYTNIYVLENKSKETSLMKICGMTNTRFIIYHFYQNTFIYIIGIALGLIIGIFITPSLIMKLYQLLQIDAKVQIQQETLFQTILMMMCLYVVSLILNIGYVYRGNLIKMINGSRQNQYRKQTIFHISRYFYIIVYMIGLVLTIVNEHTPTAYILFSVLGAIGGYGIVKYYIPDSLEKRKSHQWLNQSDQLVIFGELYFKLKQVGLFIQILIIVSMVMVTLVCFNLDNSIEMYRMIMAYMIMLPMIMFCITYKNLLMNPQKKKNLQLIGTLGVEKIKQRILLKKEWLYFYAVVALLPGVYIIVILMKFYIYSHMSMDVILFIIGYFVFNILLSMIISYKSSSQFLKEKENGR